MDSEVMTVCFVCRARRPYSECREFTHMDDLTRWWSCPEHPYEQIIEAWYSIAHNAADSDRLPLDTVCPYDPDLERRLVGEAAAIRQTEALRVGAGRAARIHRGLVPPREADPTNILDDEPDPVGGESGFGWPTNWRVPREVPTLADWRQVWARISDRGLPSVSALLAALEDE